MLGYLDAALTTGDFEGLQYVEEEKVVDEICLDNETEKSEKSKGKRKAGAGLG